MTNEDGWVAILVRRKNHIKKIKRQIYTILFLLLNNTQNSKPDIKVDVW